MKLRKILVMILMITIIIILTSGFVHAKSATVLADTLRLRKEPSQDATTIELLEGGTALELIEEEGDWYKVKYKEAEGYVSKDYIRVLQDEEQQETTTPEATPTETPKEEQNTTPEPVAAPAEMKVSVDSKLYILPLINANIIEEVKANTNVKVLSKTNGWYFVETEKTRGWIRHTSLVDSTVVLEDIEVTPTPEAEPTPTPTPEAKTATSDNKTMYANASSVFVRKGPGTEYEDIDGLVLNQAVNVVGEEGDWYKIDMSGTIGYVAKRLLSDSQTTTNRSETDRNAEENAISNVSSSTIGGQIADFAMQYLNCPYVYGASGPNSFDCSGFTMFVYKNFGVSLSHSATAQSYVGLEIEKSDLEPGDLVFFTDYETGYGIGHCGIYIGDGNFIHASSGSGYCVKISTLLSGSYYNRYETARRIL